MLVSRLLKRIAAGALGAGSSFLIAACYGVSDYTPTMLVRGQVTSADGTGIPEMRVCAQLTSTEYCEQTDALGEYIVSTSSYDAEDADADGFTLRVRDVDGPAHGSWQDKDVPVAPGNLGATIDVVVDPAPVR